MQTFAQGYSLTTAVASTAAASAVRLGVITDMFDVFAVVF